MTHNEVSIRDFSVHRVFLIDYSAVVYLPCTLIICIYNYLFPHTVSFALKWMFSLRHSNVLGYDDDDDEVPSLPSTVTVIDHPVKYFLNRTTSFKIFSVLVTLFYVFYKRLEISVKEYYFTLSFLSVLFF